MFRDYFRSPIWFEVDSQRISDEGIVCIFEVRWVIREGIVSTGYSGTNIGDSSEAVRRYRYGVEKFLKHFNSVASLGNFIVRKLD